MENSLVMIVHIAYIYIYVMQGFNSSVFEWRNMKWKGGYNLVDNKIINLSEVGRIEAHKWQGRSGVNK